MLTITGIVLFVITLPQLRCTLMGVERGWEMIPLWKRIFSSRHFRSDAKFYSYWWLLTPVWAVWCYYLMQRFPQIP